jgi:hypothetical protein
MGVADADRPYTTIKPDSLHILVFACPECAEPVVITELTTATNLEPVDATMYKLNCNCSWQGERFGATAKRHIVEPWHWNGF